MRARVNHHLRLRLQIWLLVLLAGAHPLAATPQRPKTPTSTISRMPSLIAFVQARYPAAALKAGKEGVVTLRVVISATGTVTAVTILSDPGYGMGQAAAAAVRRFRFLPALINNRPAPVNVRYTYRFKLQRIVKPLAPLPPKLSGQHLGGLVLERGTRIPLVGVTVAIPKLQLEVTTDAKGRFRLETLPPGRYRIVVYSARHRTLSQTLQIGLKAPPALTLRPLRLVAGKYEIVVIGRRPLRGISRKTLQQEELTTIPGTFGDPLRGVQSFPGIMRPPYGLGILVIRGTTPGDSSVFVDGHEVPIIYHFLGGPSVLNPNLLARIDFFPGNFTARYGRTLSGLVDVITKRPERLRWKGDVNINLIDAGAWASGPLSKSVSLTLSLRRSYIDAILPLAVRSKKLTTVLPVYYDYQAKLRIDLSADDYLELFFFGSDDQLRLVTNNPDAKKSLNVNSQIGFHRIKATWLWTPRAKWRAKLSPVLGLELTGLDSDSNTEDAINFRLKSWEIGLRWDITHWFSKRLRVDFGLDTLFVKLSGSARVPTPPDFRPPPGFQGQASERAGGSVQDLGVSASFLDVGLYIEWTWQATGWFTLIAGSRLDYLHSPNNDHLRFDPRLTMRFKVARRTWLKAAAGLYGQPVNPFFLNPTFGNPKLGPEWSEHYSIGVEHSFTRLLRLEVTAFYLHHHRIARPSRRVVLTDGVPRLLNFAQDGFGEGYGLELLLRHDASKLFYGWIAYTLMRSHETERDRDSVVLTSFDQTHTLTVLGSFRLGRGWELGFRFRATSGRPITPFIGGTLSTDAGKYIALPGQTRSQRRPFFHQLDLRVEKTWTFNAWRLSFYLDIQNVYFSKNPEILRYDYRFGDKQWVQGIPIVPVFGLRGRW